MSATGGSTFVNKNRFIARTPIGQPQGALNAPTLYAYMQRIKVVKLKPTRGGEGGGILQDIIPHHGIYFCFQTYVLLQRDSSNNLTRVSLTCTR